jgi:hypothetical protein
MASAVKKLVGEVFGALNFIKNTGLQNIFNFIWEFGTVTFCFLLIKQWYLHGML